MKKTLIALAVVGAASMIAANATQFATPVPGSFYVGLQGGWAQASVHDGSYFNWTGHKDAFTGGLYAGYQFSPYFALEAGTQYYSNLKQKEYMTKKLDVIVPFTLATKFDYPIYNRLDVFAELGMGVAHVKLKNAGKADFSKTRVAPLFEAGLEYAITPHVSVRLADQYMYHVASHDGFKVNENSILLGFSYRFGSQNKMMTAENQKQMNKTTAAGITAMNQPVAMTNNSSMMNGNKLSGAQFEPIRGVMVTAVKPECLAYKMGLRAGDVILGMDGYRITSVEQLSQVARLPKTTTTITVLRGEGGQVLKLENNTIALAGKTLFGFNQSHLTAEGQKTLATMMNKLRTSGLQDVTFDIKGYADPIGTAKYNLALSQRRAVSVAKFLMKDGVPATAIHAVGYGETHLIVTEAQYKTHAKKGQTLHDFLAPDRRVTIDVDGMMYGSATTNTVKNLGILAQN